MKLSNPKFRITLIDDNGDIVRNREADPLVWKKYRWESPATREASLLAMLSHDAREKGVRVVSILKDDKTGVTAKVVWLCKDRK